MTITTKLHTYFHGKLVGEDKFGNRYYTEKKLPSDRRAKRWVLYKGIAEPSKVPPEWHGWLHYTIDIPPSQRTVHHHNWEKQHLPNLTGTQNAYLPPGHLNKSSQRSKATADYEAWKPE
jgi:NADH:ubiquinone oxidoreductase subunit